MLQQCQCALYGPPLNFPCATLPDVVDNSLIFIYLSIFNNIFSIIPLLNVGEVTLGKVMKGIVNSRPKNTLNFCFFFDYRQQA